MLFSALALAQPAWKADPHIVILHQGAAMAAPVATRYAFEEAVRQGADGVEFTLRRTKDKYWVVTAHDHLVRDYGPWRTIADLTLAECLNVDMARNWAHAYPAAQVPLARDVFEFCRNNGLLMSLVVQDYEGVDEEKEIMALLEEKEAEPNVIAPAAFAADAPDLPAEHAGWSWRNGGEEDPAIMARVVAQQPRGALIAASDARSLSMVLGRRPGLRRLTPFVHSTPPWEPKGDPLAYRGDNYGERELPVQQIYPFRIEMTDHYNRRLNPEKVKLRQQFLAEMKSAPSAGVRLQAAWSLGKMMQREDAKALIAWGSGQWDAGLSTKPWSAAEYDRFRQLVSLSGLARLRQWLTEKHRARLTPGQRPALNLPGGRLPEAWELAVLPHDNVPPTPFGAVTAGVNPKDPKRPIFDPAVVQWLHREPDRAERVLEAGRWRLWGSQSAFNLLSWTQPGTRLHTYCVFLGADSREVIGPSLDSRLSRLGVVVENGQPKTLQDFLQRYGAIRARSWLAMVFWRRPEERYFPPSLHNPRYATVGPAAQEVFLGGADADSVLLRLCGPGGPYDAFAHLRRKSNGGRAGTQG